MASAQRGRRVAPRRSAGSPPPSSSSRGRRSNKKQAQVSEKFAAFFSLAGLGTVALTAGSAINAAPSTVVVQVPADNDTNLSGKDSGNVPLSLLSRARAASRSDVRISSADAKALNAAATAPKQPLSTDPRPLTTNDRLQLRAFAADSNQLDALVTDTQNEQAQAAAATLAAARAAQIAAAKAKKAAQDAAAGNNNMTYPSNVGGPGRAYGAPLPTGAQLDNRTSPVAGSYQLSARYGQRGSMWSTGWHTGIDFVIPTGTPVRAATSGVIINAGWAGAYGKRIEIATADGYIITYNHLSRISKYSGTVTVGEELGRSGSTGNTTGPHLHFEVLYNDDFVNPAVWLWGSSR